MADWWADSPLAEQAPAPAPKTDDWWSSSPLAEPAAPAPAPEAAPEKKPEASLTARATERAAFGALGGATAPEILRYGGKAVGALPFPPAKTFGKSMEAIGVALTPFSKRIAPFALGGAGGAAGELVEEEVKKTYGPTAGTVAGMAAEFGTQAIPGPAALGIARWAAGPSMARAGEIFNALISRESLSAAQRKILDTEIEALAGKLEQGLPQRQMFGVLQTAVGNIKAEAGKKATLFEAIGTRAPGAAAAREGDRAAAISTIGRTDRELTDVAADVRGKIVGRFSEGSLARNAEYEAQKAVVDGIVKGKEAARQYIELMPEYKEIVNALNEKLLMGAAGLAQPTRTVSVPGLVRNLENMREALAKKSVSLGDSTQPGAVAARAERAALGLETKEVLDPLTGVSELYAVYPTAYEAIDHLRRKLGDAAWKEGVEGFESLTKEQAKTYYAAIDKLQSKYVGEAFDTLQLNYNLASRLLDKYRAKTGGAATGLDKFDPTQFARTDKSLVTTFFGSKGGVDQLVKLTGDPQTVATAASDYAARSLADKKTAREMKTWAARNSDLLSSPHLVDLKAKVASAIAAVENVERKSARTLAVGKSAEKKAVQTVEEAERVASTILADAAPAARVRDIILSGKKSTWDAVTPILAGSLQGRRHLNDALGQVLADAAKTRRKSLPLLFRDDIAPFVEKMIPASEIAALQAQINKLAGPITPQKITFAQKALSAALATGAGTAAAEVQPVTRFMEE